MPNSDLLLSLLLKINQNQLALEAAIMALTNWVEQIGRRHGHNGGEQALQGIPIVVEQYQKLPTRYARSTYPHKKRSR